MITGDISTGITQWFRSGGRRIISRCSTVEKTLVPIDKNNFSPRIGFAYLLSEKHNLVVRGGYGVYYDRISTRYANTQLFNYPYFGLGVGLINNTYAPILPATFRPDSDPFVPIPLPSAFPTAATIPSPLTSLSPVGFPISGVFIDPEIRTPYIQQYNAGIQWSFAKNYLLDAGYVGNKGTKLLQVILLNQPTFNTTTGTFDPNPLSAAFAANRNLTGGVHQVQTTSLSNYNSLQLSLTRRFSDGLQYLAAYTYGKSMDYYSGNGVNELGVVPGDQWNWRTNYGRSDYNREHRFVLSGVYSLPKFNDQHAFVKNIFGGWEMAGIAVFQSGLPFSIIDNPGNTIINRANINTSYSGDFYTSGDVSSRLAGYFTTGAFSRSAFGTASFDPNNPLAIRKETFDWSRQKNIDISFIKFIPITDSIRAELRAEMFNVFNWVNYANPNNNISGANFGRIERAATGPRVIQLAFKFNF